MTAKRTVLIQVILLAGALLAGFLLKGNLLDGPRLVHRALGALGGLTALLSAILLTKHTASQSNRVMAWVAVVSAFGAGAAGTMLKTTASYDAVFNAMRGLGVLAVILSVVVLSSLSRKTA